MPSVAIAGEKVELLERTVVFQGYFRMASYLFRHSLYRGGQSGQFSREVFERGQAAAVLPYDPLRDEVVLIRQFRAAPLARGDLQPWGLEAIAGRIDPGETPEEAGRREAWEEARLNLGELLHVANYYPSPGAKAEFLYSYVALCDLPDGVTDHPLPSGERVG